MTDVRVCVFNRNYKPAERPTIPSPDHRSVSYIMLLARDVGPVHGTPTGANRVYLKFIYKVGVWCCLALILRLLFDSVALCSIGAL